MTQNHNQLRELFIAACDLPKSEQKQFVEENCVDPELKSELRKLLDSDLQESGLLSDGKTTNGLKFEIDTVVEAELPSHIGQYEVKSLLGEGGMGVVYLARQQNPSRDVAIKVIRSSMTSPELLHRFELESEFLGKLKHQGIVSVFEAGLYDQGPGEATRPFLAMEYVEGQPLRRFILKETPSVHDRLRLLIQICDAIHHAHQRGIIHRDLKPGNILVKANGQPVILDFGVARAIDADFEKSAKRTRAGQLIGTLAYMSPEQVNGKSSDVDIRSDIYSLGVIGYELLVGELPYSISQSKFLEAARVISEETPVQLSTRDRKFRGDLNTVILKAIEKDSERRYQSAAQFKDDLQRFLDREPVMARPATAFYQLRRFAMRNKTLVAGIVLSLSLLIAGIVGTTMGMISAQRETARRVSINEFMNDFLLMDDPASGNADIKMSEALAKAAAGSPERFGEHPELQAEVDMMLGNSYHKMSNQVEAARLFKRAYELRKSTLGISNRLTRKSGAFWLHQLAKVDKLKAVEIGKEILEHTPRSELDSASAIELKVMLVMAQAHREKPEHTEQALRELRMTADKFTGRDSRIKLYIAKYLGITLSYKFRDGKLEDPQEVFDEATELFREVIAERERSFGSSHMTTLHAQKLMARHLFLGKRLLKSEELYRLIIKRANNLNEDHEIIIWSKKELALVLYNQSRYAEAAELHIEATNLLGKESSSKVNRIVFMFEGLPILEAGKRYKEGEVYARFLLKHYPVMPVKLRLYLARFLSGQNKNEEAVKEFKNVVTTGKLNERPDLECIYKLFMGEHHLSNGDIAKAKKLFASALEQRITIPPNVVFMGTWRFEDAVNQINKTETPIYDER